VADFASLVALDWAEALGPVEKELDAIDAEIDSGVTSTIAQVSEEQARQLLACMKVVIGLERIGDLLLSFASSAQAAGSRLDSEDARELTQMATLLEKMLGNDWLRKTKNSRVIIVTAMGEKKFYELLGYSL